MFVRRNNCMKRFFSFLAVALLAVSLFTCVTQTSLQNISAPMLNLDFPGFRNRQGTIFDREKYDSVEEIQSGTWGISTRGGGAPLPLPQAYSLKEFAPIPGNQGDIGSCFAWASAYAARTIIESQYLNRTDKILTTKMAFSPMFLYHTVRQAIGASDDEDGASILPTVLIMSGTGLPRRVTFDEALAANIYQTEQQRPYSNPITGYGTLFNSNTSPAYRIEQTKKTILNGNPVVIGIFVPDSFNNATGLWVPEKHEIPDPERGHALCVVGYDDKKYGGSFEIINSWGEEWGNSGFIWIDYDTFGKWVIEGWVITDDTTIYETLEFTGKVGVEISGKSEPAQVRLLEDGIYRLPTTVKNGSQIRLNIEKANSLKNESIYTYAFYVNSDNSKAVKIRGNEWVTPGNTVNMANFIVLYSRSELDIDSLLNAFVKQTGIISSRLGNIIGKDFVLFDNSKYEYSSMQITADLTNTRAVAGMVLSVAYDANERPISDMMRISGGTFTMGSPSSETGHLDIERQKKTTVGDYYIGVAEVTVGDFREFVNATGYQTIAEKSGKSVLINRAGIVEDRKGLNWKNPGFTQEDTHPVIHISLYDAVEYCNWRSRQEKLTPVYTIAGNFISANAKANGYRLPTEAEWEYACRAGTTTPFSTGRTISANQANFAATALYRSTPVRKYTPNQWGIYDMHGNVYEWCSDNPEDNFFTVRGGSWLSSPQTIRSAFKDFLPANISITLAGFRLARNGS